MTLNQKILLVALLTILALSLMVKIDFATADMGRHIKNGEIMMSGDAGAIHALLTTNYYSYTEGDSPFINHHWLSGVIFFILFNPIGFFSLSILYIACMLIAFWLIFDLVRDKISPFALLAISLVAIPVIASRAEVRPEVFTYLLVALFIWICHQYAENKIGKKWLFSLPVLQLLWVNMHIGFIFGPFIIGVYFIKFVLQKDFLRAKSVGLILFASCMASLANPSHIYGALYPFKIFGIYSYRIIENQSISFLSNLGVGNLYTFLAYKTMLGLVLLSYITAGFVNWRRISLPIFVFSVVFGAMGWIAIRDFPLFGLIGVMAFALNMNIIYDSENKRLRFIRSENFMVTTFVAVVLTGAILILGLFISRSDHFGIGIEGETSKATAFFKENNLKGPIFNNYDIGSYLIYNLFPDEKVFFDNRPEAYSKTFVENDYIHAMEDPEVFKRIEQKYGFNTIFFYYRDYTPWGQAFITKKVFDPDWAPVYADKSILILLKRNSQNYATIKQYEVPKESFRISQ